MDTIVVIALLMLQSIKPTRIAASQLRGYPPSNYQARTSLSVGQISKLSDSQLSSNVRVIRDVRFTFADNGRVRTIPIVLIYE